MNLPQSDIDAIASLTGKAGMYPSRSELIRVAVRAFLIKTIAEAKSFEKYKTEKEEKEEVHAVPSVDPTLFVQVPMGDDVKTYKLVPRRDA